VARSFARMQVEAAGRADRPLAAGCHDRHLDRLAAQAGAWLPEIEATGELPGIDDETWLSAEELAAVRTALPQVLDCCAELAGFAVPPSIIHGDLHLGNVARGPGGCRFLRRGRGRRRGRAAGPAAGRLPPGVGRLRAARAARPRLPLAAPLGALHQAVSYTSIVASQQPPIDVHRGWEATRTPCRS
jgi:hypothetical protein